MGGLPLCSSQKFSARKFFIQTKLEIPPNIQILDQICQHQRIATLNEFINNKQIKDQLDNQQKETFKNHAEQEWREIENKKLIQDNQKVYDEVREFDNKYFIKRTENIYQLNNDKLLECPKPDHLQRFIVFGLQESGKTTFINNLINVFHGVKYFHRFRIVAEYRKAHYDEGVLRYRTFKKDQQGKIHLLEIIDTPSYLQQEDYIEGALFTLKIASFLSTHDIQDVNMILFVKKYQNKQKAIELDKYHSYILNQIKRLFGENYLHYLRFILTYSTEIERLTPATQTSSQFLYITNQVNNNSLKFTNQSIDFRKELSQYDYDWYKQLESVYDALKTENKSNKTIKAISEYQYSKFRDLDSAKIDLGRRIYNMFISAFIDSHNYKSALAIEQQFINNPSLDGKTVLKYELDYAEENGQKEKFKSYIISVKCLEEFLSLLEVDDLPQHEQNQIWNSLNQPQQFQNFNEAPQDIPKTIHYEQFKLGRTNSLFSREVLQLRFKQMLEQLLIKYQSAMKSITEMINEYIEVHKKIEESSAIQSAIQDFSSVLKKYILMISGEYVAQQEQFNEIKRQLKANKSNQEAFVPK